jgi:hypothetical protein
MNKLFTPVRAIRANCLNCQGGRPSLVRKCQDTGCPFHIYRMGRNPQRAGIGGSKRAKVCPVIKEQPLLNENSNSSPVISKEDRAVEFEVVQTATPLHGPVAGGYFAARSGSRRPGTV